MAVVIGNMLYYLNPNFILETNVFVILRGFFLKGTERVIFTFYSETELYAIQKLLDCF